MLFFIAEVNTSALKSENYDIINFDRQWQFKLWSYVVSLEARVYSI
jgi:hypothetical protein